ncbi:ATP-binding protein [Nocardioides anomalus]|uniref:ATP-binding protein n=1 Tax=Nocardioides anomalus TaxID=2712223 RepID=A0A6G6WJG2_9ACTN|nr:ATP-binding protein [Nocardioides anomalus]QIG45369.1 ATP-binding protein [Nocardioides anomalus]
MADVSVTAAVAPEVVDRVLDELAALWERSPEVAVADRTRFEMGVVEILGNIVEHAFRVDDGHGVAHPGGRELTVEVTVDPEALTAVLGDNGQPVELDLGDVTMPDADAESGRGLALALAALDHLEHQRVDGRNRWTLRCDRH